MRRSIYIFIVILYFAKAEAQQIIVNTMADDGQEIPLKPDTTSQIKYFGGKQVNDTAYLIWKVQDMLHDGTFFIYRSDDGKNFNVIGTKKAIGTLVHSEISYYIKDVYSGRAIKYYRVVYISATSEYLVSNKLLLNDGGKTFAEINQGIK